MFGSVWTFFVRHMFINNKYIAKKHIQLSQWACIRINCLVQIFAMYCCECMRTCFQNLNSNKSMKICRRMNWLVDHSWIVFHFELLRSWIWVHFIKFFVHYWHFNRSLPKKLPLKVKWHLIDCNQLIMSIFFVLLLFLSFLPSLFLFLLIL